MGELVPKSEPLTGSAHLHPGHLSPQPGEAEVGGASPGRAHGPAPPSPLSLKSPS